MATRPTWGAFEHRLNAWLKEKGWQGRKFLLAVSGGVDSMAMLASFAQVVKSENLRVVHLHHGLSADSSQNQYRMQTKALVEDFARSWNVEFRCFESDKVLQSEKEMRDFRYQKLQEAREQEGFDFIVLGHHQEDQIESQILHLLRGCGLQGLRGMQEVSGDRIRPFLGFAKRELQIYVEDRKIPFLEDPSNQNSEYLRNWVRNQWLPRLEEAQKGLKQSFMNSLLQISREIQSEKFSRGEGYIPFDPNVGIPRQAFVGADKSEKKQMIYRYLTALEVVEISQGQVEEILKRLDKRQKELTFRMSQSEWTANAQYIVARKKL